MSAEWFAVILQALILFAGGMYFVTRIERALEIHAAVQTQKEREVDKRLDTIEETLTEVEKEMQSNRTPMHWLRNKMMKDPEWENYQPRNKS